MPSILLQNYNFHWIFWSQNHMLFWWMLSCFWLSSTHFVQDIFKLNPGISSSTNPFQILYTFFQTKCMFYTSSFHKRSAFSLKLFMIQRSALSIPHQLSESKNTWESVFSPKSKVGSSQLRGNFRIMSKSW